MTHALYDVPLDHSDRIYVEERGVSRRSSKIVTYNPDYYSVTIVLVGDYRVGKSSILEQFINEKRLIESTTTIGVDLRLGPIKTKHGEVRVKVWDTAGMERFRTLVPCYFSGADAIVLVGDCSDHDSLRHLYKQWYRLLVRSGHYSPKRTIVYAAVNKWDLWQNIGVSGKRSLKKEEVKEQICKLISPVDQFTKNIFYISAKTGKNVKDMFTTITDDILDRQQPCLVKETKENAPLLRCWERSDDLKNNREQYCCWPCTIM